MADPAGVPPNSGSRSALVVDDDLSAVRLLEFHLADAGFRCSSAGNVGEAWRMVKADPPDVALVDVHLPGAFGWELAERMRSDQLLHRTPIVMLSSEVTSADRDHARGLNAAIVMKPFEPTEVLELVASLLEETVHIPVRPAKVAIFLDHYRIEGIIHLPLEQVRFSDGWETVVADKRSHLPLTGVTIFGTDREAVGSAAFLQVAKAQIQFVIPLEDSG